MRYPLLALSGVAVLSAAALAAPAQKAPAKSAPKKPLVQAMRFTPKELDLAPGETYPVELLVPSPTGRAVKGELKYEPGEGVTVKPDARFKNSVPGYGLKTYPKVTASRTAEGEIPVKATFEPGGEATLLVRAARPEIEVTTGEFKLTVKVTNPFKTRVMNGRVEASNPDRFLQNVTAREFKIGPGKSQELVFPLPGAAPVEGDTYDFTFQVETYQGYRATEKMALSFPPHSDPRARQAPR
ncbi:MAG: hypothetical protein ACK47B_23275 [Armatimonadota bacterium]